MIISRMTAMTDIFTKVQLQAFRLVVPFDSLSIGAVHRAALLEKKEEFERCIAKRIQEVTNDSDTVQNNLDNLQNRKLDELKSDHDRLQKRLNELYHRFEREWLADPRENEPDIGRPEGSLDSEYLAQAVGRALREALSQVCLKRPLDPIEFLAFCLKQHSRNENFKQREAIDALTQRLEEEEEAMRLGRNNMMRIEKKWIKQEEDRRKAIYKGVSKKQDRKSIDRSQEGEVAVISEESRIQRNNEEKICDGCEAEDRFQLKDNLYTIVENEELPAD